MLASSITPSLAVSSTVTSFRVVGSGCRGDFCRGYLSYCRAKLIIDFETREFTQPPSLCGHACSGLIFCQITASCKPPNKFGRVAAQAYKSISSRTSTDDFPDIELPSRLPGQCSEVTTLQSMTMSYQIVACVCNITKLLSAASRHGHAGSRSRANPRSAVTGRTFEPRSSYRAEGVEEPTSRAGCALGLLYGHRVYLVAAFSRTDEPVNYRLDRMSDVRVSGATGTRPHTSMPTQHIRCF